MRKGCFFKLTVLFYFVVIVVSYGTEGKGKWSF